VVLAGAGLVLVHDDVESPMQTVLDVLARIMNQGWRVSSF
jgi:hypothetical protein